MLFRSTKEESFRELLLRSAKHHGVATATDLGDYYRLHTPTVRRILNRMVVDGDLEEAIGVARAGLEKHPNYPSARLTLGRALLDSGDPAAARGGGDGSSRTENQRVATAAAPGTTDRRKTDR